MESLSIKLKSVITSLEEKDRYGLIIERELDTQGDGEIQIYDRKDNMSYPIAEAVGCSKYINILGGILENEDLIKKVRGYKNVILGYKKKYNLMVGEGKYNWFSLYTQGVNTVQEYNMTFNDTSSLSFELLNEIMCHVTGSIKDEIKFIFAEEIASDLTFKDFRSKQLVLDIPLFSKNNNLSKVNLTNTTINIMRNGLNRQEFTTNNTEIVQAKYGFEEGVYHLNNTRGNKWAIYNKRNMYLELNGCKVSDITVTDIAGSQSTIILKNSNIEVMVLEYLENLDLRTNTSNIEILQYQVKSNTIIQLESTVNLDMSGVKVVQFVCKDMTVDNLINSDGFNKILPYLKGTTVEVLRIDKPFTPGIITRVVDNTEIDIKVVS